MNITIEVDSISMISANWQDGVYRYHVWIRKDRPEDTIHKNQLPRPDGSHRHWYDPDYEPHRALDLNAKRWAAHRAEIIDAANSVAGGNFAMMGVSLRNFAEHGSNSEISEFWKILRG